MEDIAIHVENLSKLYTLGQILAYHSLRESISAAVSASFHAITSAVHKRKSTPDKVSSKHKIWALKDVSFDVKRSDVLGIIGPNGAGKSTLLKILTRITDPTEGFAEIRGRVGSLLEVGTGFHPELTGRENIFLNGAIIGMKRAEIKRKFNEIVEFSGVEQFIDTPLKRYSSGMQVRLAFAVAAHLEPEILLVDEVLAVGDAAFQQKSLGKMGDVAREGRTVIFVSHNMEAIKSLCSKVMLLEQGQIKALGNTSEIVDLYLNSVYHWDAALSKISFEDKLTKAQFRKITIMNNHGTTANRFDIEEGIKFVVNYELKNKQRNLSAIITIFSSSGVRLFSVEDIEFEPSLLLDREPGQYSMTFTIPPRILNVGKYYFRGELRPLKHDPIDAVDGFSFEVYANDVRPCAYSQAHLRGFLDLHIKPDITRTE
jgi:lipopolysaccharide transport system ATP-binding protein